MSVEHIEMLEKMVEIGLHAELKGDFVGRTGTRVVDGRMEWVDPTYKTYRQALQELAIILGNKATKNEENIT